VTAKPIAPGRARLYAPGEAVSPPFVVSTSGLHSSASTWVFNVVRELMIDAAGAARVAE